MGEVCGARSGGAADAGAEGGPGVAGRRGMFTVGASSGPHTAISVAAGKVEPEGADLYVLVGIVGSSRADQAQVTACLVEDRFHGGLLLSGVTLGEGRFESGDVLRGAKEFQPLGVSAGFPVGAE